MAGQRGTLNLVGTTAYLVLSVPVSAFDGVDDDGDGGLSTTEYGRHRDALASAVVARATLLEDSQSRSLQGLMMALSPTDNEPLAPAPHLVVMGRFELEREGSDLQLDVELFGAGSDERMLSIAVTRPATDQRHTLTLTPRCSAQTLFP